MFDDFGAQRIVTPWHHQGLSALQGGAKNGSSIAHSLASPWQLISRIAGFGVQRLVSVV
jgi:hypothetical protein